MALSIRSFRRLAGGVIVVVLTCSSLKSQAWLLPQGGGVVTFSYQNALVRDHVDRNGDRWDLGRQRSHAVTVESDYSLTDRLAIRVGMPYVWSRYNGSFPHTQLGDETPVPIDDGSYHSTFQDVSLDVRYNLKSRPLMLTPFFRAGIPSQSYAYFGHAAVGRDQREYHIGLNAGRRLDPILPNAYVQGRYSYAFVERVVGIAPNRSNTEFQIGYFLNPRWTVLGSGQWLHAHSGIEAHFDPPPDGMTPEQWPHHDQIAKSSRFDFGGGMSFTLNSSTDVFLNLGHSFNGTNGHINAYVLSVGITRTFGTRFATRKTMTKDGPGPAPETAFVCTCAKTK